MGKLVPVILMIIGGAIGAGAGIFVAPPPTPMCGETEAPEDCEKRVMEASEPEEPPEDDKYYVAMKNQFVIPVIQDELVQSLVVLTLSLETTQDDSEIIFSKEPKLRDVILQVLFDHSHIGGFSGAFTESSRLSVLRTALREAVQSVVGNVVSEVIITDIVRQEM